MRKLRHKKEEEAGVEKMRMAADHGQVAEVADTSATLQELLDQELERLPDKYRTAIVLCDLEGLTMAAAAKQVGCPQGTLSVRLVRGRAMLAKRLARHGLAVSGGLLATALCQNAASACVPAPLVVSTVQAATLMAAGKALATGAISAKVVALTEGVLKAMLMTKLKITLAVVLTLNLIGAGIGLVYCQTAGSGQDKGGGPPTAQEKADKPVPTDQQPAPKKEATEEVKAGQPIDYQKMAQEARWQPPENWIVAGNSWTMCVMADGKKVYEWPLPAPSTFFIDSNCVVYHAVFPRDSGCEVVAYDLKAGKLLWRTRLKAMKDNPSRGGAGGFRANKVRLEHVNNEVLAVYGDENDGQYVEIVDLKTGKTVGHKAFPGRQPEPKEEKAEKIDYQKIAQEARWKQPEKNFNRWTICVMADGKKVYDWPVPMPSTFFVDSNCVLYHAGFPRWASGCEVVAYDLRGGKLWRTRLKGAKDDEEGLRLEKLEKANLVRLERVNEEVLAVYGDESNGRYIEIVDMKTGKTVGHKVFTEEDADKKPGANADPPEKDPAVKECLTHIDTVVFGIRLRPPEEKGKFNQKYELLSVDLHVADMPNELAIHNPYLAHARITKEQAAKIVAVLTKGNFFRASLTNPNLLITPKDPHAVISVDYRKEGTAARRSAGGRCNGTCTWCSSSSRSAPAWTAPPPSCSTRCSSRWRTSAKSGRRRRTSADTKAKQQRECDAHQ